MKRLPSSAIPVGPRGRACQQDRLRRNLADWRRRNRIAATGDTPDRIGGAIARDEFFLTYQPKMRLRHRRIESVEALIRWEDPRRGTIAPMDFIPAAEKSGEIRPLSEWVLHRAIADQLALREAGHDLPVFVNIAATLLTDAPFLERAAAGVAASGARIGFEITETSVIRDPATAIANLKRLTAQGIDVAIDDYGAGLSSLAYLKQLPARELKIDKLFITELASANRDPLIVRSTIDLAHAMEMDVVAEGIEDETVLALLTVMGCDLAQGYHISRPLRLAALLPFLDCHAQAQRERRADEPGGIPGLIRRKG